MKTNLLISAVLFWALALNAQVNTPQQITPDSLSFFEMSMCSDGQTFYAIGRKFPSSFYLFTYQNGVKTYNLITAFTPTSSTRLYKNNGMIYAQTSLGMMESTDGINWSNCQNLHLKPHLYTILFDADKIYATTRDTLNYFDGTSWHYYFIPNMGYFSTPKIVKGGADIYFNSSQKLYRFDGIQVDTIFHSGIYDMEWNIDRLYFSVNNVDSIYNFKNNTVNTCFYNDLGFGSPNEFKINTKNDTLFIYDDDVYGWNRQHIFIFVDHQFIQHNHFDQFIGTQIKICNNKYIGYFGGRLNEFDLTQYEDFGIAQSGVSYQNLDINQVDAWYGNRGQMFWDEIGTAKYYVPKGSGKTSMFAGGLWLSALTSEDTLAAAMKFATTGYDFSPGPLRATGALQGTSDTAYAQNFDRIWKLTRDQINYHHWHYNDAAYNMPVDIAQWPAHGNTAEGYAQNLAPFVDVNSNGQYEPQLGDYPEIKGDMSLYWIFNDALAPHGETNGGIMGVEIHAQAYAYACDTLSGTDSVLNYTTFLDYTVYNRGLNNYSNLSSGFWTDADLGDAYDDYIGCHVGLNSAYFYNGDDIDGDGSNNTYGANPPAQFVTVLSGPEAEPADGFDNDNDGTIDENGEKLLMNRFIYFNNNASALGDPELAIQYYNYMNGYWKDARPLVYGGTGYQPTGGTPAKYMFPGTSDPLNNGTYGIDPQYALPGGWTEENESNPPKDKRGLISIGDRHLNSGEHLEYTLAFVWSRGDNGAWSSVEKGFNDVARITEMYQTDQLNGCNYDAQKVEKIQSVSNLALYPNPTDRAFVIQNASNHATYKVYNIGGQAVLSGTVDGQAISVEGLSKGLYLVKITQNSGTQTLKLNVE